MGGDLDRLLHLVGDIEAKETLETYRLQAEIKARYELLSIADNSEFLLKKYADEIDKRKKLL